MMNSRTVSEKVRSLELQRLGDDREAGLWITSLPWPRMSEEEFSLGGAPTYTRALGQWPDEPKGTPRRLLMIGDGGNQAPATLTLDKPGQPQCPPPQATAELMRRSPDWTFMWEQHRLRIDYQDKNVALAMGLRTGEEVHWWEACRLVVLEQTPTCQVVEMAGAIPLVHNGRERVSQHYRNEFLHKHNWLYGHILARLHSNGVCEIFAHHINSKYVDEGSDLAPAVPVIGMWTEGLDERMTADLCGQWDGSRSGFNLGQVKFDVSEVSLMASQEEPGLMDLQDDLLVWQPYLGCALFGGVCAVARLEDEYILKPHEQKILRGMARTLRFSLSLSDRSPRVARYLAPPWWYGLCEEFTPEALLPVYSDYDPAIETGRQWLREANVPRGFEVGSVARGGRMEDGKRPEPGWEGEIPYAQFLSAWRYSDAEEYDLAMRSAYHFADVIIDHAAKLVRMHGYPPIAFALPMNRVQGPIAAFLETGDDYLLDEAEAVVEGAYRQHRNAWPRMAVGRDACFVRSAVLLWRYFANDHFRNIAYKGAISVADSQRDNGSFGDQGGGAAIHQWSGYITKPWMGLLATNGVLDYLELFPDEPRLLQTVKKFADWLMSERLERDDVMTWTYQHDYDGGRRFIQYGDEATLPTKSQWHQETLARLLGYVAIRFNDPAYLDAWAESNANRQRLRGDHSTAAGLQFLPWIQSQLWRAQLEDTGTLHVRARHFGERTPQQARIATPTGDVELSWVDAQHIDAPENVRVTIENLEPAAATQK